MSCINVNACRVLNNPAPFATPLQFECEFECRSPLKDDLEWKLIYVGSAEDEQHDQELESVLVGPVEMGINRFIFQGDCPDPSLIPKEDVVGVTVVLVTCSYNDQEFIRIGYYVQNEWTNPAWNPPDGSPPEDILSGPIDVSMVQRNILSDKPRVTRFHICWDEDEEQKRQHLLEQQHREQRPLQENGICGPVAMQALDPNQQMQQEMANKMGLQTGGAMTSDGMDVDM